MSAKLPDTKEYRVRIAGAIYSSPRLITDALGEESVITVSQLGVQGETIALTAPEATRLLDLDAIVAADEPLTYDEMDDPRLDKEVEDRGITVTSSGADPEKPLRSDKINALALWDQGHGAQTGDGPSRGFAPEPDEGRNEAGEATASGRFSAASSVEEIEAWIREEKPNAGDTVAAAGDDPAVAARVLEAEENAHGGDARSTVEGPLSKIIDSEEG